jgi:hypothetical protein
VPGGIGSGLCRLPSRFASILPKGRETVFTMIKACNLLAANPAKYATIRMDGEELTN